MINSKWIFGKEESREAYDIRRKVFVEELGLSEQVHFDEYDRAALHILIGEDDKWLATGRLYDKLGIFKIGGIAVLKEVRDKKVGDLIVRLLLNKCFDLLADEVYVDAREDAVGFYEKLNFKECGEKFELEKGDTRIPMKVTKENSPLKHSCSSCVNSNSCEK